MLQRETIIRELVREMQSWPFTVACWEGGSTANARRDEFSDVDFVLAVKSGQTEQALNLFEDHLQKISKIELKWRVPEPAWHGHSQCFYKMADTSPQFFLDFVVMQENAQQKFLEVERHGTPLVYFDKENFVRPTSVNDTDLANKRQNRLENIKASFPFFLILVEKEILRNRPLDALHFYRALTGFIVELYGMKYRPDRYDFGLRYVYYDFPPDVQKELETLCFVGGLSDIQRHLEHLKNTFNQLS